MAALVREFPDLRVTFNLVPSLLVQLQAFARDDARDRHLELGLRPALDLGPEDARFCLDEFFHAHTGRMVAPHARYRELFERVAQQVRAGGPAFTRRRTARSARCGTSWCGWIPFYASRPANRARHGKGRGFSEADKDGPAGGRDRDPAPRRTGIPRGLGARAGRALHVAVLSPDFAAPVRRRRLRRHARGLAPAGRAVPLPGRCARSVGAQRGAAHAACSAHVRWVCGRPKAPCPTRWPAWCNGPGSRGWPPTRRSSGTRWDSRSAATRTASLHHAEALYRPYHVGKEGQAIACAFRDHALSDLIGFTYASWSAEDAAHDFVRRVAAAGASAAARRARTPWSS